ncbi:MAG TPA: MarR family transcriptional regulator [Longimicrobiales bacterium]|nr:MarR family transcriptional regulator [Longimicrobiales bacterium]
MTEAHQLLRSVIHIADTVQERLEKSLEPSGLSLAKLGALRHLAEAREPLPLGQLAERISCVKSNVTQLVDRLEAEGLVKRVPDPADRRSVRAAITDEGLKRCQAGLQALEQAEGVVVSQLDLSDQATLTNLLTRLR